MESARVCQCVGSANGGLQRETGERGRRWRDFFFRERGTRSAVFKLCITLYRTCSIPKRQAHSLVSNTNVGTVVVEPVGEEKSAFRGQRRNRAIVVLIVALSQY